MSQFRSPFEPDALLPLHSSISLELPSVFPPPSYSTEQHDVLSPSARFSISPFRYATVNERLPAAHEEPVPEWQPDLEAERRLKSLRKSPGFALLAESVLLLKACQLDMDVPPRRRRFLRDRLARLLREQTGASLDPDQLHITFTTTDLPAVDDDGLEHYTRRLSLTEVAQACFDPWDYNGLTRVSVVDAALSPDHPSLRSSSILRSITEATWPVDYENLLDAFWRRQRNTYRTLSRLTFLDGLARQLARKRISKAGYRLALDAMGLSDFPDTLAGLEAGGRGERSEAWGLRLNGVWIPGVFQVRSKQTSHCFIHVAGAGGTVVEYISEDPAEMTHRLLQAINASGWHRQILHTLEAAEPKGTFIKASLIDADVFDVLTKAQENVVFELLADEHFDRFDLLKPLARAMALASAVDFWPSHFPVLDMIPEPSKYARELMGDFLHKHYGLTHDPDHVFIAYRSGKAQTPLGDARRPATVVNVPSDKPVCLSEALITHYKVQYPEGYIDQGGHTAVYLDTTGKGVWAEDQVLPVEPLVVERHIRQLDFLTTMSGAIIDFWDQNAAAIERAFNTIFIRQALVALKKGHLSRGSFDSLARAVEHPGSLDWVALGFYVQGSSIGSMTCQYPGLLILEKPGETRVLYQAGHADTFVELHSDDDLHRHLRRATTDEHWRQAVMQYVPHRHRERLDYLLKLWGGIAQPDPPVSLLRPWTDTLYNVDTRKALSNARIESRLDRPLSGFLREVLKRNALEDAQDKIVTAGEVAIRYWSARLNQLQWLLAPMSALLTPALLVSLAAELGVTSLTIALANLPGGRYEEKKQAVLSVLSMGLLRIGPQTPRLVRSLGRITKPAGRTVRASGVASSNVRSWDAVFRRAANPRQTRLEKFFHTSAMLKRWTIASHPRFGNLSVHAWKLGRRFLLWTSDRGQARTLVVSTHGHYLPWSSTVRIPLGTEIRTYAPHGHTLIDPFLHRIVSKSVQPYAISTTAGNTLAQGRSALPPLVATDKLMAGTSLPGRLRNYTLSKFQTVRDESYEDIGHIVRNSNVSPFRGQLPATPMDVLTVRNRFGMPSPTLADLFNTLYALGIHYDRILLVHCRCAAVAAVLGRAPVYRAPLMKPLIANTASLADQLADTVSHDPTHSS
jgi:hypothetical protein